jgi:copper chaperone
MKTIEVKTNIMCGSCVAKVTPFLDSAVGQGNWKVDIESPAKTLTITSENITEEEMVKVVEQAGYKAQKVS